MGPVPTIRRLVLAGLAAALVAAPVATAGTPTPPKGVRDQLQDPVFVLSMPDGAGAWTLWSGTVEGDRWWMLTGPRAGVIAGAPCPETSAALTVCFHGRVTQRKPVVRRWTVAVGRLGDRVATISATDLQGRSLRRVQRDGAYVVVAHGTPKAITVVARDRRGHVVARRFLDYRTPRAPG